MRFTTPRPFFILLAFMLFCAPHIAQAAQHKTIEGGWSLIKDNGNPVNLHGRPEFHITRGGNKWFLQMDGRVMASHYTITVTAADAHSIAYQEDIWAGEGNNPHAEDTQSGWNYVCHLTDSGEHLSCTSSLYGPQTEGLMASDKVFKRVA